MAIYGAQLVSKGTLESDLRYDTIGKNSEVIATGDPLSIQSGVLSVATAVQTIYGVAAKAATMASGNQTAAAPVYPAFIPVTEDSLWYMGCNANLTGNATDGGTYYKITGATGVVQIDVVSGVQTTTSRIVEIVKVDPLGRGNLNEALVRFVKTPYTNVEITT